MSRRLIGAAAAAVVLTLSGCSSEQPAQPSAATATADTVQAQVPTVEAASPTLPVTFSGDDGATVTIESLDRVVVLDDATLEIAHALGVGDSISATPSVSIVEHLASQADSRFKTTGNLTVEGIVSMEPTLVIGSNIKRHGELVADLRAVGVTAVMIDTSQPAPDKLRKTGTVFGLPEQGEALAAAVQEQYDEASALLDGVADRPRVMVLSSSGAGDSGATTAAGASTPANQIITNAGGLNTGAETGLDRYQSITAEGLVAAAPEIIVVADSELDTLGGAEGIWQTVPGLSGTPAGQDENLIVLEDVQLKSAGLSSGVGVLTLLSALHPAL